MTAHVLVPWVVSNNSSDCFMYGYLYIVHPRNQFDRLFVMYNHEVTP